MFSHGEAGFERNLEGFRPAAPQTLSDESLSAQSTTPRAQLSPQPQKKQKKEAGWWERAGFGGYARMPYNLHRSGIAARIGPDAVALYAGLLDQANRNSSTRFKVSDRKLAANTRISTRNILELRKVLIEASLIKYTVEPGDSGIYELLPFDATEVPVKERPLPKRKPRGRFAKKNQKSRDSLHGESPNPSENEPEIQDDAWAGLPQILRGSGAKYARPYAKFA
jgi:hypothetical protein